MAMAGAYDDSFHPPEWWFKQLEQVMKDQGWKDPDVIRRARLADGRDRSWGPDRLSKLRKGKTGTIQMIVAISEVADIPSPVYVPADSAQADALKKWLKGRSVDEKTAKQDSKFASVSQALDTSVKAAKDQTKAVVSKDEGSPRGRGHRRAPRGG